MTRYVLKRLLYSLVALFVAMSATFFIIHSVPGNNYQIGRASCRERV